MKRTVSAVEARQRLGELLNSVYYKDDEVVIERDGKAMAILVPTWRHEATEQDREGARREFLEMVERIHERNKDVPYEVIKREVDEAMVEVRPSYVPIDE